MADTQAFPQDLSAEPMRYSRMSGLAISGFILSLLFVIVLGFQISVAFQSKTPMILPEWLPPVPFVALALNVLASILIRRSEGWLAGGKLATLGFWIALISGLGYQAYEKATYFVLRQQSESFTLGWLADIQQGKLNSAFLKTEPPGVRLTANADDEKEIQARFNAPPQDAGPNGNIVPSMKKGMLDVFKERDFVGLLRAGGDRIDIRPQGVRHWEYKDGGFTLRERFALYMPEATHHMNITTHGVTSPTGEFKGRQWNVVITETGILEQESESTQLGKVLTNRYNGSRAFLDGWLDQLQRGDVEESYLRTQPAEERTKQRQEYIARYAATAVTAGAVIPLAGPAGAALQLATPVSRGLACDLYLPHYYRTYHMAGLVKSPRIFRDDDLSMTPVTLIKSIFRSTTLTFPQFRGMRVMPASGRRTWREEDGHLYFTHDAQLGFTTPPPNSVMMFMEGMLTTECSATGLDPDAQVSWRLVAIEPAPQAGPNAPGRPGLGAPQSETKKY